MDREAWAIYVVRKDGTLLLVWQTEKEDKKGRRFWLGGSGLTACIVPSSQQARSLRKKVEKDFRENHKGSLHQKDEVVMRKVIVFLD